MSIDAQSQLAVVLHYLSKLAEESAHGGVALQFSALVLAIDVVEEVVPFHLLLEFFDELFELMGSLLVEGFRIER
jgi:hypothetical protein